MLTNIFTVYDNAAARFLEPFHAPTIEYALRQFRQTVNTPDHLFSRFPEDYTLFHVGSMNQETGVLTAFDAPRNLGVGITFLDRIQDNSVTPIHISQDEA